MESWDLRTYLITINDFKMEQDYFLFHSFLPF